MIKERYKYVHELHLISTSFSLIPCPVNIEKSGFKKRSYNWCYASIFFVIAASWAGWQAWDLIVHGFFLVREPVRFVVEVLMLLNGLTVLWCEIEDQGDVLSVRFGPLNLFGRGLALIPFHEIQAYRAPKTCCEGICSFGICIGCGWRSLVACGCTKRRLVIEYKRKQTFCGMSHSKIIISVAKKDYKEFIQMMDMKFGLKAQPEESVSLKVVSSGVDLQRDV